MNDGSDGLRISLARKVDDICDRFETEWKSGKRPQVETLLAAAAETERAALLKALVPVEFELRLSAGEQVGVDEYLRRFPKFEQAVRELNLEARRSVPGNVAKSQAERRTVNRSRADGSTAATNPPAQRVPTELPEQFGRYKILRKLGQGGMGAVYLAHDQQLDRQVALKVPHFAAGAGQEILERFYREARAAATIHHPNLCPVFDVGEIDGRAYLTMAFIEGKQLAQVVSGLTREKPLPERQAALLVRKVALALDEAHRKGIVHRDLKPANIMIDQRKEPVIMDFGLARRTQADDVRITQSGAVMGSPAYMSPEQVLGKIDEIGPTTDVYSLGVILYELLAAQLPFQGPVAAVLGQIIAVEAPPLSEHRPDIDPALAAICAKAMAKKIGERYASMGELARALTEYLKGKSTPGNTSVSFPELPIDVSRSIRTSVNKDQSQIFSQLVKPLPPRYRNRKGQGIVAGALGGLLLLAAIIIKLQTADGTLVLEVDEPGATVTVLDNQGAVEITRESDGTPLRISVDPGTHQLQVEKDGFKLFATEFSVAGGKETRPIRAKLERTDPATKESPRAAAAATSTDSSSIKGPSDEWIPLFNGRDLTGWKPDERRPGNWRVNDGVLTGSGPTASYLYTTRTDFADFNLRVEARINSTGNSGLLVRVPETGADWPRGYEAQIGGGNEEIATGGVYVVRSSTSSKQQPQPNSPPAAGEWFTMEMSAQQNRFVIKVNGVTTTEIVDDRMEFARGYIALQQHNPKTSIEFRKIEIQELATPNQTTEGSGTNKGGVAASAAPNDTPWAGDDHVTWQVLDPIEFKSEAGATIAKLADESLLVSGTVAPNDTYVIEARSDLKQITGVRLEAMEDDSLFAGGPGRAYFYPGGFQIHQISVQVASAQGGEALQALPVLDASADYSQPDCSVRRLIDTGSRASGTGWATVVPELEGLTTAHLAVVELASHPPIEGGTRVIIRLKHTKETLGRFRLSVTDGVHPAKGHPDPHGYERQAAQWVLNRGGIVYLASLDGLARKLSNRDKLPDEPFHLKGAAFISPIATVTGDDVALLAKCSDVRHLGIELGNGEPLPLVKAIPRMESITFYGSKLTDEGLLSLPDLPHLKFLNFDRAAGFSAKGLAFLRNLPRLEMLNLGNVAVTPEMLEQVAHLQRLFKLNLHASGVTDDALLRLQPLRTCHTILLTGPGNRFSGSGLRALKNIPGIWDLVLTKSSADDSALAALNGGTSISSLSLGNTKITDQGLRDFSGKKNLSELNVPGTAITSAGVTELHKIEGLAHLDLSSTQIDDAAVEHLKKIGGLQRLMIRETSLSDVAVAALRQALPKCDIQYSRATGASPKTAPEKPVAAAALSKTPAPVSAVDSASDIVDSTASVEETFAGMMKKLQKNLPKKSNVRFLSDLKARFDAARKEVESYRKGHIIFGRIVLEKGAEPRSVLSQMVILEHGYFVDAVGGSDRPVGFRLSGYEPVEIVPKGPGPIEDLGVIRMNRLPADRLASAKGRLMIESRPGAPRPDQIQVTWSIVADPINTPSNGIEPSGSGFGTAPIRSKVASDGSFSASGFSPAKYYLSIEAANCAKHWQYVEFSEGEKKGLEPISVDVARKVNVEYVVSPDGNFSNGAVKNATLTANERWRAKEDKTVYGWDIEIAQKDKTLLMKHTYGPCFITDLGIAKLAEKLNAGPADSTNSQNEVPIENGHVYLIHQGHWKRWILLRAELRE